MVDRIQATGAEGKTATRPARPVGPRGMTARLFEAFRRTHRDQVELAAPAPSPEPRRSLLARFAGWAWGGIKSAASWAWDAAIAAGRALTDAARWVAGKVVEGLKALVKFVKAIVEFLVKIVKRIFERPTGGELHDTYLYFLNIKLEIAKSAAKGRIAEAGLPHLVGTVDGARDPLAPAGIAAGIIKSAEDWQAFHRNNAKSTEAGRQDRSRIEGQRESRSRGLPA